MFFLTVLIYLTVFVYNITSFIQKNVQKKIYIINRIYNFGLCHINIICIYIYIIKLLDKNL